MTQTYITQDIITSPLWDESDEAKLLFITMLAEVDKKGVVRATRPELARLANLSRMKIDSALIDLIIGGYLEELNEGEWRLIRATWKRLGVVQVVD